MIIATIEMYIVGTRYALTLKIDHRFVRPDLRSFWERSHIARLCISRSKIIFSLLFRSFLYLFLFLFFFVYSFHGRSSLPIIARSYIRSRSPIRSRIRLLAADISTYAGGTNKSARSGGLRKKDRRSPSVLR